MKNLNRLFKRIFSFIIICYTITLIGCGFQKETATITTSVTSKINTQISSVSPHALGVEDILSLDECDQDLHYETIENNDNIDFSKSINCFVTIIKAFNVADFTTQDIYDNFFDSMNLYVDTTPIEGTLGPIGIKELNRKCGAVYDYTLQSYDISKSDWDVIYNIIKNKWPVLVWYTNDIEETKRIGKTTQNEMPVITIGFVDNDILVFEPMQGYIQIPIKEFRDNWEMCGRYGNVFYQ